MTITDTGLCPFPKGDSSIRRMAQEAAELGFDSLVAIGIPSVTYAGIRIREGVLIGNIPAREVSARIKHSREDTLIMIEAGDNGFNRAILGMKGVHVLCGIHNADRHAFDHVTAKMAADNHIAIDISIAPLIQKRGAYRQKALHRYRDILMLSRKFSFPLVLSTHAGSVLDMRSVREISGLATLIGFELHEVEQALAFAGRSRSDTAPVREIS